MQCRSCGTDNREGRKFCSQCASTLSSEILCPACGAANEPGDKFCGECARALAVAIQQTLTAHNSENPGEPIRVRIGLHTGEAIKEGEDFFGKTVILGARIASQASGGQVLVSSLLKALVESSGEFEFGDAHDVELKGLSGTHRVFLVGWCAPA